MTVGEVPENPGFNSFGTGAVELSPDSGVQLRRVSGWRALQALWRGRKAVFEAFQGQPEAVSGELDAFGASPRPEMPDSSLNIYGLPLSFGPPDPR